MYRSCKTKRKTKGYDRFFVMKYLSWPMSLVLDNTRKYQCDHVFLANKNIQQHGYIPCGWLCFSPMGIHLVLLSNWGVIICSTTWEIYELACASVNVFQDCFQKRRSSPCFGHNSFHGKKLGMERKHELKGWNTMLLQ
jgi:hypothetical protein